MKEYALLSIILILIRSNTQGGENVIREWFQVHRHEAIVGAIMIGISLALAIGLSNNGDLHEALARSVRR